MQASKHKIKTRCPNEVFIYSILKNSLLYHGGYVLKRAAAKLTENYAMANRALQHALKLGLVIEATDEELVKYANRFLGYNRRHKKGPAIGAYWRKIIKPLRPAYLITLAGSKYVRLYDELAKLYPVRMWGKRGYPAQE
jgi:hypothetical protein